ncbi:SET domain-containing protein [Lindgomyces ingoldianus]|uniref:SET domain-containing protein n=1 Tax=Lindgomyces ingoldianus TaxID=673940 RepID=A0ACB6QES8_9PLEO|nr:SET domain-containing protein [Lindgomyces ingoldianus]KAF2465421.1 SET domain-containing protein [Lindgomyces ingoldianus]
MQAGKRLAPSRPISKASHKRQKPSLDADDSETNLVKEVHEWFTDPLNGGWLNPDVYITHNKTSGFHVRASCKLSSPTVAVCPLKLTLSYLNLDHTRDHVHHVESPLQKCLGKLPNHVLSYLVLIEQRSLERHSHWFPYIACLPSPAEMNTPVWFSEEDLKYLEGTNLVQATSEKHILWQNEWREALSTLKEAGISVLEISKYDIVSFKWAATIMSSRSFASMRVLPHIENNPILFPVVDFLNHCMEAKVDWDFSQQSAFSLNILDEIEAGAEIFNNYDPKRNGELLLGYGFCVPGSLVDAYAVKIRIPDEIRPLLQAEEWSPDELEDAEGQPHFLLARDYLYPRHGGNGQVGNIPPFLRGIPPFLTDITWLRLMHERNIKPRLELHPTRNGRILVAIIYRLLAAMKTLCDKVSGSYALPPPQNPRQVFAKMYSDGQLRVVESIHKELNAVLYKNTIMNGDTVGGPKIITVMEAFSQLEADFPMQYQGFIKGISKFCQLVAEDFDEVGNSDCEDEMWMYTLIFFFAIAFESKTTQKSKSTIDKWIQDLLTYYPLADLSSPPITEAANAVNHLQSRLEFSSNFDDWSKPWETVAALDSLGNHADPPISRLREKVIVWAVTVVQAEALRLPDHERLEVERYCMYMHCIGEEEKWMLEDVTAEEMQE